MSDQTHGDANLCTRLGIISSPSPSREELAPVVAQDAIGFLQPNPRCGTCNAREGRRRQARTSQRTDQSADVSGMCHRSGRSLSRSPAFLG